MGVWYEGVSDQPSHMPQIFPPPLWHDIDYDKSIVAQQIQNLHPRNLLSFITRLHVGKSQTHSHRLYSDGEVG